MPRDDSGPSAAPVLGTDGKAPLKRGDACLYCRKRRIRCSAEKPSCQHCTKLKRECVYDTGKPVSRVKQLEEKVAELEGYLKAGSGGSVLHALSQAPGPSMQAGGGINGNVGNGPQAHPHPPPLQHHSSSETSTSSAPASNNNNNSDSNGYPTGSSAATYGMSGTGMGNGYDARPSQPVQGQGVMSFESFAFSGSTFGPTLAQTQIFGQSQGQGQGSTQYLQQQDSFASMGNMYGLTMGSSRVDPLAVEGFDFTTLDPSFMALINSLGATSTGGMEDISQQQQEQSFSGMGSTISGGMNGIGGRATGMDLDNTYASGLTPFLDPTNGQGLGSAVPPLTSTTAPTVPSMSTLPSLSSSASPSSNYSGPPTYANGSARAQPFSIQPSTPGERVSYHAFVSSISDPNDEAARDALGNDVTQNASPHVRETPFGGAAAATGPASSPSNGSAGSATRTGAAANGQPRPGDEKRMGKGWKSWIDEPAVPPELQGGDARGLVGGWFDPTDLPRVARDHLLDLFFSGMRMFGQEFHIPRFFASLSLPAASRPHPCLLYTMYLMASRLSSSQPIRSLEKHFYDIAMEKLEESIVGADRLFDAVRAATILAVYKYSLAKYHEAWMMTGRAARLAISCGLHAIPSSVFRASSIPKDHRADLIGLMRQRSWVIPPPADAINLGERIWAFWAIYTVDRCGSIAAQWPPCIPDDVVTTPYARPLAEYELGLVNEADDVSVGTLYSPVPDPPLPHYAESTYINLRMRAICILERASKLMYIKPEPGWQEALATRSNPSSSGASPASAFGLGTGMGAGGGGSSVSPDWGDDMISNDQYINLIGGMCADSRRGSENPPEHKGWTRTARVRTPKAYGEVLMALRRAESDLPPERRTNWEEWDGNVQDWHFGGTNRRDAYVLHFVLGCAWMFLFDVFSFNTPNDQAVAVARRLAFTIRAVMNDAMGSDLDVFIAMTWSFVVKILIREVKRLHAAGEHKAAGPLENEIEIIVQALQIFGKRYSIASFQAMRADKMRKATAEDTKFMENPAVEDEAGFHGHEPGWPIGSGLLK